MFLTGLLERERPNALGALESRAILESRIGAHERALATAEQILKRDSVNKLGLQITQIARARLTAVVPKALNGPPSNSAAAEAFADRVNLSGLATDPNAAPWPVETVKPSAEPLDGFWSSRRLTQDGTPEPEPFSASVSVVGPRILMVLRRGESRYLIEAQRRGGKLVGWLTRTDTVGESQAWTGLIVSNERIDGQTTNGRWDLRRRLTARAAD